jgi:hypothetical protein
MAQNWNSNVNTDFYGQDGSYNDNTEKVEFKSGRTINYLKNSRPKKTHSLNLRCQDKGTAKVDGKTEFEWFLYWYENTAKSGTVPIYLTDIITGNGTKQYLIKVESWSGQRFKEINLQLEEV